ncbi:hypothetical protein GCM10023148_07410 [Actinokineospora soli]
MGDQGMVSGWSGGGWIVGSSKASKDRERCPERLNGFLFTGRVFGPAQVRILPSPRKAARQDTPGSAGTGTLVVFGERCPERLIGFLLAGRVFGPAQVQILPSPRWTTEDRLERCPERLNGFLFTGRALARAGSNPALSAAVPQGEVPGEVYRVPARRKGLRTRAGSNPALSALDN